MKIGVDCPQCLIHRGFIEISRATTDDQKRIETTMAVLKTIVENLNPNAVPGAIGTLREKVIKRQTGNLDIYAHDRVASNEHGLRLLPDLTERVNRVDDNLERFRLAAMFSAIGNLMEFDILGYSVDMDRFEERINSTKFGIDNSKEAFELVKSARRVLFLTDNAGEIVFDRLLVEQLKRAGSHVTVAVKGAPIMNDATMSDAIQSGIDKVADKVITTGEACVGLMLNEASDEFRRVLKESDLVVAKGMGHYETMTDRRWSQPVLYVLVAKCRPVAAHLGVERGQGVILLRRP
jgi:hypothetical protein